MTSAFCSAPNCGSKYGNEGITLHRFPMEKPQLVKKWMSVIRRGNFNPSKNHYICSLHFTEDKFIEKSGYRFLKYDAVPSKFHVVPRAKALLPKNWPFKIFTTKTLEQSNYQGYMVEFKVKVDSEDEFRQWLRAHEDVSKVSYKLVQKYPKTNKQLSFKAEFGCRHTEECPAKLLVRIRVIDPKIPRLKDTDPLSYPCTIVMCHLHTHAIETTTIVDIENEKSSDIADEVKTKFTEMYKGMYSEEQAWTMHHEDLKEEYPETYDLLVNDKYQCPDIEWVKKLYEELSQDIGEITSETIVSSLATDVKLINGERGKAKLHKIENEIIIALCTPLMERAHSLQSSGEIVFLDTSGYLEKCKCYAFVLMTYSCTEGLPLGVLLTTSVTESVLVSGFQLLANLLPDKAFGPYGSIGPEAFLVDNNEALQSSLKAVFPDSTILLCSFTMLKSFWHFLWNEDSKIEVDDRCHLFSLIHSMMKSKSSTEFEGICERISQDEIAKKYDDFQSYFKEISNLSEKWAVSFKNLILDKDKDVSAVEIASHVMKDKMYLTKAYNMAQLFKYLANDLDAYYSQKVIHCINDTIKRFIQFSYKEEMRTVDELEVTELPSKQFKVTHIKSGNNYFVDMDLWVCSCSLGIVGARCKHQYAVCISEKVDFSSFVPPDNSIKKELHWIATNSVNSLLGNMETESGDSDVIMEEDYEYDPRQDSQKRQNKQKSTRKTPSPKEEARIILERVVKDLMTKYDNNPSSYHQAIVAFAVNYQSLASEDNVQNALVNFGKTLN